MAQQLHFALGEQSDRNDTFLTQIGTPRLTSVRNEEARPECRLFRMWTDRSGGRRPCQHRYTTPTAPKLGRQALLVLLSLLHRRRIVGGMNFNRVAEAVSAH